MSKWLRAVLAWAAALAVAGTALYLAWTGYDTADRPDGNPGHVFIDFSGQWLMGRMLVRGEGPHLYHRSREKQALEDAYPPGDAATVYGWLIGAGDDHPDVGGPLYPPIHGVVFYPLGLLPPQPAYRVVQVANFLLTFLIGFLVQGLTRGRVWAPVAVVATVVFPGYNGAASLGQNALLSLALVLLGWLLIARNRPVLGGIVWGLLAFKPVWAAAFFVVPLLTCRWRVAVAMLLTGLVLADLTLPLVGGQAWLDWFVVGRAATRHYATDETWVFLSRDLQGVPRRWLLHFQDGIASDPDAPLPALLGWVLWLMVAAATVIVVIWRWRPTRAAAGPGAAFLLLGAILCCYHFMYYDLLLAGLPICLLFTEPHRYLEPVAPSGGWVWEPFPPTLLALLIVLPQLAVLVDRHYYGGHHHYPPLDTFCLLALWGWCGWQVARGSANRGESTTGRAGTPPGPSFPRWSASTPGRG